MATKTFKIGLSATDKQNMAQDIYEQVEALLFSEYNTSSTYNTGDYVVYSGQLYRCLEDNVTGSWDSTKWELATLQDLVDDVNGAVASVDNKANVDGNYPTLTAGLADNLTPYSEDSGTEQDEPFISQGTGTANNTEIVTVGDYSLLKEKQGNTIVVNQLLKNRDFVDTSNWYTNDATFNVSNNVGTLTASAQNGDVYQTLNFVSGHKYLISVNIKLTTSTTQVILRVLGANRIGTSSTTNEQTLSIIVESGITGSSSFVIRDTRASDWDAIQIKQPLIIDLTQMFNGNIPQDLLDHPENFSRYYNGDLSYNTGTLVNANGNKLVSTGRNIWDEEWEVGGINDTTGENRSDQSDRIRSKNYIEVIPNNVYYAYIGVVQSIYIYEYDKNKNFIQVYAKYNTSFQVSSNCSYIRIRGTTGYGTTYNNNITISLYYTPEQGGEGYDQYYPYEAPYEVNTGSEVLRSAGSVKDVKLPSGEIIRRVGSVDLGTQTWTYFSDGGYFRCQIPTMLASALGNELNCDKYLPVNKSLSDMVSGEIKKGTNENIIYLKDSSLNGDESLISGTLYYPLDTPTTEQGTSFAENLPIDDYGMMYWDNTNGVPQGANIFYQVNYKGFVDDMYSRVSGDSSDYALNSELNAKFETYLKSLSGYDATATQVLKNVEGTFTWITEE